MRFVKLELTWATSSWLVVLSPSARLCWVMALGYCKASGNKGRVKRLDPLVASRLWFVGEEDVRQMEIAAINDGAIVVENGDWVFSNWSQYQDRDDTNSERQRRYREAKKSFVESEQEKNSNAVTVRNALRNANNTEEKRREEKRRDGELEEKRKPNSNQEVSGGLSLSVADAPPVLVWWDKEKTPEGQIIETLRGTKHYPRLNPDRSKWEELGLYVREFVPDKQIFACELQLLSAWVNNKRSKPWQDDPHAAIYTWFARKEADWRRLRAARQMDGKNGKASLQEETLQEKAERIQARLERRLEERNANN